MEHRHSDTFQILFFLAGVLEARRSSKPSDEVQILGEELDESHFPGFQGEHGRPFALPEGRIMGNPNRSGPN